MVNYGIFISRERSRKGVVTPIVCLSGNSFRTFWNVSSSAQLDSFVIWFEYQNLEYLLYFHHQLTGPKRYTPTIIACFWEQDNGILMLEQLIDQTSQSHHCSVFWRHQSKGSVGTLHHISCSSIEVQCEKLSLSGPPASNAGSPIKTIGIGLRLDFNWRFNLMLVCSHILLFWFLTHKYHQHQFDLSHIHFQRSFFWLSRV